MKKQESLQRKSRNSLSLNKYCNMKVRRDLYEERNIEETFRTRSFIVC